jgi:hypothetical protein
MPGIAARQLASTPGGRNAPTLNNLKLWIFLPCAGVGTTLVKATLSAEREPQRQQVQRRASSNAAVLEGALAHLEGRHFF